VKGGGAYLDLVGETVQVGVGPALSAPARHEWATDTGIHKNVALILIPQQHVIPRADHALRLLNWTILADPSLTTKYAIQDLIMRSEIEAGVWPLLDKDILLVALGDDVAQVLRNLLVLEDDRLVRVRLAVEDEDEVRRVVQRVVHKELEVCARERGFVVCVGDERALVVGRRCCIEGFEIGGFWDAARLLLDHA
jgi:hypothetical protein